MPRYLVERPCTDASPLLTGPVDQVRLVHAYVTHDGSTSFCLYDAPSADAIQQALDPGGPPAGVIIEVRTSIPSTLSEPDGTAHA